MIRASWGEGSRFSHACQAKLARSTTAHLQGSTVGLALARNSPQARLRESLGAADAWDSLVDRALPNNDRRAPLGVCGHGGAIVHVSAGRNFDGASRY
eukprot:7208969-Pyramimonas_sp.AAC.1